VKFAIYDGSNTSLLANSDTEIEARNARHALQIYLTNQQLGHIKFYNTADNNVVWKTTPFIEHNGQKYRCGRVSWWGVKPLKITG